MDFVDALRQFARKIEALAQQIKTEEATKHSLILPLIQLLGYDVFDPNEVVPEFTSDVGTKKGEKVDYAIMVKHKPAILIEAKPYGDPLTTHDSQLFRYFAATEAKFAILTNGTLYKFYSDLQEPNKMDDTPFLEFDMLNIKEALVPELKKFHKENFDPDSLYSTDFHDEFHFQKMSPFRFRVYKRILEECLSKIDFYHKTIVVKREFLDMKQFGNTDHIAYNYFTRLVIQHSIKNLRGEVYIFPDERNRVKQDNFLDYLKRQLNFEAGYNGLAFQVLAVEPRGSKQEEALQINDLFLGIQRQRFAPSDGKWKITLSNEIKSLAAFWRKTNTWEWKPQQRRR